MVRRAGCPFTLALCCYDGFFVTHTKDVVNLTPTDMCLPPYDPYRSPVPCMDMECPPVRSGCGTRLS